MRSAIWFRLYLRRTVGALFVAALACGAISVVLDVLGHPQQAQGANFALLAVLWIQHVYWVLVPESCNQCGGPRTKGRP